MMYEHGQSDRPVVPAKSPNKVVQTAAEGMEGRGLAKGKRLQQNTRRTQCRDSVQSALERVRQIAVKDRKQKFTALMHHVYNVEMLKRAYLALKRDASPGIDGETWKSYLPSESSSQNVHCQD